MNKPIKFKEFGQPLCTITNNDIKNGNITLFSYFINKCKTSFICCKICNKKGELYYTQEQYLKKEEEAIYSQLIIKDLILPKFLAFIFEDNNGVYIPGNLTKNLIYIEFNFKGIYYKLVGGVCISSEIHFSSFLCEYREDYFCLSKEESYYYDG